MSQFWKGKVACETTTFGGVCPDMPSHAQTCLDFRPILKSCSFPIHRPGEIKNSHEPPAEETFFFAISLSKTLYDKKI